MQSVRVTLSPPLDQPIDGAWWPHTAHVGSELPQLVALLSEPLGEVVDIAVNWKPFESFPDLNSYRWEAKHQRVMTLTGAERSVNLLVVPHMTNTPLATMVLRHAAGLPIYPEHRDTSTFRTADRIVRAARAETAQCQTRAGCETES